MFIMKEWGTVLTGRDLGKKVREELLKKLDKSEDSNVVIVDFKGVKVVSHSFCDEVFGLISLSVESILKKIKIVNTSKSIEITIKYVISERKIEQNK